MRGETLAPSPLTLRALVDEYLGQHVAEANTIQALRDGLKLAVDRIPVKPRAKEREHGLGTFASTGSMRARSARGAGGCPTGRRGTRTRRCGRCSRSPSGRKLAGENVAPSAGLARLVPYSMRHSFASFAIAAGVSLFFIARLMGSSVEQIDKTYGHLLPDSEEYLRGLLDTYDNGRLEAAEGATR
jgi:hypothetical protein